MKTYTYKGANAELQFDRDFGASLKLSNQAKWDRGDMLNAYMISQNNDPAALTRTAVKHGIVVETLKTWMAASSAFQDENIRTQASWVVFDKLMSVPASLRIEVLEKALADQPVGVTLNGERASKFIKHYVKTHPRDIELAKVVDDNKAPLSEAVIARLTMQQEALLNPIDPEPTKDTSNFAGAHYSNGVKFKTVWDEDAEVWNLGASEDLEIVSTAVVRGKLQIMLRRRG